MRIFLMTDMEGVAGIANFDDWCQPSGRCYATGQRLATNEVNAVVEGFFAAGAARVQVMDGHGYGALDVTLLDKRVEYARGWPCGYDFGLDDGFDAVAYVGQHAKSRTSFAHMPHTGSFIVFSKTINGVEYGEFGEGALCAGERGIPVVFAAGDQAFTEEAQALVPGIATVAVKRGVTPGRGDECSAEAYAVRNLGAVHLSPALACERLQAGAYQALTQARSVKPLRIEEPYEGVYTFRGDGATQRKAETYSGFSRIPDLLNAMSGIVPPT